MKEPLLYSGSQDSGFLTGAQRYLKAATQRGFSSDLSVARVFDGIGVLTSDSLLSLFPTGTQLSPNHASPAPLDALPITQTQLFV